MTATDDGFVEHIVADLSDPTPMRVYADWLDEHGRGDLAYAYRWMAGRGYRPGLRRRPRARMPWGWWHENSLEEADNLDDLADVRRFPRARLPKLLFRAGDVGGPGYGWHSYHRTFPEAVDYLAAGLRRLHDLVAAEEPAAAAAG
jgi:uncharacterized protein (TIGR02996 family)